MRNIRRISSSRKRPIFDPVEKCFGLFRVHPFNTDSGRNIVELMEQKGFPRIMHTCPKLFPVLRGSRREQHFHIMKQFLKPPHHGLGPPLRCIGAAMPLQIQFPNPAVKLRTVP